MATVWRGKQDKQTVIAEAALIWVTVWNWLVTSVLRFLLLVEYIMNSCHSSIFVIPNFLFSPPTPSPVNWLSEWALWIAKTQLVHRITLHLTLFVCLFFWKSCCPSQRNSFGQLKKPYNILKCVFIQRRALFDHLLQIHSKRENYGRKKKIGTYILARDWFFPVFSPHI